MNQLKILRCTTNKERGNGRRRGVKKGFGLFEYRTRNGTSRIVLPSPFHQVHFIILFPLSFTKKTHFIIVQLR